MNDLQRAVEKYLSLRRTLGHKLEREGSLLPDFVTYLKEHGSPIITTALAVQWAIQPTNATPSWCAKRLSMVRCFARHLRAVEPATEVPPVHILPNRKTRQTPYLYSDADIDGLLDGCRRFRGPLRPTTYETLLCLLVVTGMRVGEAIALDRSDVDTCEELIIVRNSKFGKSREVPVHKTTIEALRAYADKRDRLFPRPKSPSFFVSQAGTRLIYNNVHHGFLRLVRWAGLENRRPRRPRLHDLRHSFAVNTLLGWYRAGVDVEPRVSWLSTYLGHVNPTSTYWYLTAAPELLSLAAQRLEDALGDLP